MGQFTVKQLRDFCDAYIKCGYGDRMIVISDDNEGNGFHGMFYGFTIVDDEEKDAYPISDSNSDDIEKIIILG